MDDLQRVADALVTSRIFTEYASAFYAVTGIGLCVEAVHVGTQNEDLLRDQDTLPVITVLAGGMYKVAVPIRDGAKVVAVIRTGAICKARTPCDAYPTSKPSVAPFLTLLSIFAEQLGTLANQLVLHQMHCEPGMVVKAKQYIAARISEPLHLEEVAQHAHVSSYYLCKMFKKSTGMNFSNYVARLRVEAAKALLRERKCRISEIALDVGFRSLTHFNRVFKRFIGESPRAYRRRRATDLDLQPAWQVPANFAKKQQISAKFGGNRLQA